MPDISTIATQGPWAALCVFLLLRIFKKNDAQKVADEVKSNAQLEEYTEIIKENQVLMCKQQELQTLTLKVIEQNQQILMSVSSKYDAIESSVGGLQKSMVELNVDIRDIYRTVCKDKEVTKNDK